MRNPLCIGLLLAICIAGAGCSNSASRIGANISQIDTKDKELQVQRQSSLAEAKYSLTPTFPDITYCLADGQELKLDLYLPEQTEIVPPLLVYVHGERDQVVLFEQSQELYQVLQEQGIDANLVVVQNAGHGFIPSGGAIFPSRTAITNLVADFFDSHLC